MADMTVAIIGAGSGGIYLAAELGTLGCRLRLTDLDETRLGDVRARGGLDVESGGFVAIERVTTDIAAAIDGYLKAVHNHRDPSPLSWRTAIDQREGTSV
jgi:2-polyprenyl-6-methoxyphenol hydroxylase-like FAD-dependent oxidoreductase